ncbi:MAG TPA: hypothetical protein VM077_00930 [Candidatus Limnocylindrales bacterium]|nr:hypothetical protein [Candidatus Limnocylindrales bacterium]
MKKIVSFFLAIVFALTVVASVPPAASADHGVEHEYCEEWYSYITTFHYWDHEEAHYSVYVNCGSGWTYSHRYVDYYWYYGA